MILEIEELHLTLDNSPILQGINLQIKPGEVFGLVGQSGCGKSSVAKAILSLLPVKPNFGQILFQGDNLLCKTDREMQRIRGSQIGMISQNVMSALHPTKSIGIQIAETVVQHKGLTWKDALVQAEELLHLVRFPNPKKGLKQYPHECSGGMRQRAMIAIALSCDPTLLIADEPTTALDVTIQAQIMDLLQELQEIKQMSTLFITHDLSLVAGMCDRVAMMKEGKIVEEDTTDTIFYHPKHPYTKSLLKPYKHPEQSHLSSPPLITVSNLSKNYGTFSAVKNVSFHIEEGETLGLIGESGCGKSTLAKMFVNLITPSSGNISTAPSLLPHQIQMVFQDPYGSLNPRMHVSSIIAEGLDIHHMYKGKVRNERIRELMSLVDLNPDHMERYPHQFSGGQRQRIGIARALAVNPKILVCDEPLSSLDVTTQHHILELLLALQKRLSLTLLFISHDLSLLKNFTHRTAVMTQGALVEIAPTKELFQNPTHPYTKTLLSAIPVPDPRKERERKKHKKIGYKTKISENQFTGTLEEALRT